MKKQPLDPPTTPRPPPPKAQVADQRTGADYFLATNPSDDALADAIYATQVHGKKLITEQNKRAGLTTASISSIDPSCICKGNWRLIVEETEKFLDKPFIEERTGNEYTYLGVMHGSDDYYYVMWRKEDTRLLSCVGSFEQMGFVPDKTTNEQITELYDTIDKLEEKLEDARENLQGLLHANSLLREFGGGPTIVDDDA
jgi:hypothetical protein